MKRDAHVHSPFCPHGTTDSLSSYIERAILLGVQDLTFTEHAPLPEGFVDTTPTRDSGMSRDTLEKYLTAVEDVKSRYRNDLTIRTGLEVDFIEGFEEQTTNFLDAYGQYLDDSILSVHFLQVAKADYVCIDYSKELYLETADRLGGPEQLYSLYYTTVLKSVAANLGKWKPKRIGHFSLIHKFQHVLTTQPNDDQYLKEVLHAIHHAEYEIDMNSAGFAKPYCQESYPPERWIQKAIDLGVPVVFGSDAHQAKDFHQFSERLLNFEK
ncbi:histidinol-phosphatase HisJ [Chryseomicrobium palamuruense]|uniref:Histidinol-phosphatase n=1 Tax=Chryseomicrobium palamuruense TaxID=682973 RepID=A0ABV8UXX1_9BACL